MKNSNFNAEMSYNDNRPAIKFILETENTKEIRILMKKGQKMEEHQTPFPIVVHLISGAIDFEVKGKTYDLKTGAILSLDGNVPHSLDAKEDSMVRLSISKQDQVERVKSVVEN